MNSLNVSISRESLFAMLNAMSLSDRKWLVKTLTEQVAANENSLATDDGCKELYKEVYDKAFSLLHADWGGDGDALDIAESLHDSHTDSFDLLIAATAIAKDYVLVTGNVRHFNRIPELHVENWMQ